MKKWNEILVLVIAIALVSCNQQKSTNSSTHGIAKIMCDESFRNILDQEVEVFEYSYPDAHVMVDYTDEKAALDSLLHKNTDLIIVSRDLTDEQREILKKQGRAYRSRKIAVDAVAIIVNKANDIEELSLADLRDIFSRKVERWGQVSPTSLKNENIEVVFDGSGTGVMHYIQDKFMDGAKFADNVYAQKSTEDVFLAVETHKNAIGFVGVSWITADLKSNERTIQDKITALNDPNSAPEVIDFTNRIKVMDIRGEDQTKGMKPYQAYIFDGSYPLFRTIYAIDASASGTLDHGFFSFLTGVIGQKIILQTGIVPASAPVRTVELVN